MSQDSMASSGLRRAALALHALGEDDRAWLLERLPAGQQASLRSLLAELSELGMPRDGAVIRAALCESSEAPSALTEKEARKLCYALEQESPALQSLLLAALGAAERASVLGQWQSQLQSLPSPVSLPDWTPRLRQALLDSWRDVAHGDAA